MTSHNIHLSCNMTKGKEKTTIVQTIAAYWRLQPSVHWLFIPGYQLLKIFCSILLLLLVGLVRYFILVVMFKLCSQFKLLHRYIGDNPIFTLLHCICILCLVLLTDLPNLCLKMCCTRNIIPRGRRALSFDTPKRWAFSMSDSVSFRPYSVTSNFTTKEIISVPFSECSGASRSLRFFSRCRFSSKSMYSIAWLRFFCNMCCR